MAYHGDLFVELMLFYIFINQLPESAQSCKKVFADEKKRIWGHNIGTPDYAHWGVRKVGAGHGYGSYLSTFIILARCISSHPILATELCQQAAITKN